MADSLEPRPVWDRDLAVLKAIYAGFEASTEIDSATIQASTGLDRNTLYHIVSLWVDSGALKDSTALAMGGDFSVYINDRTEKGMRLTGAWPDAEQAPRVFVETAERVAENQTTPEATERYGRLAKELSTEAGRFVIREAFRAMTGS